MKRGSFVVPLLILVILVYAGAEGVALYTDWLWFEEVGFGQVFTTILYTKTLLDAAAGTSGSLFLYLNLRFARRGYGGPALVMMDEQASQLPSWALVEPLYRRLLLPGCVLAGLFAAGRALTQWPATVRFLNPVTFGVVDLQFNRDVGFYVFTYPFLVSVYQFLSSTLWLTLVAAGAVYVLSRGVGLGLRGPVATPWAKGHLLGLVAGLLVLKGWGYSLDRYGLLFSPGGASFGASYTDVNASLPTLNVLIFLAGIAAIACLTQMRRRGLGLALATRSPSGWRQA